MEDQSHTRARQLPRLCSTLSGAMLVLLGLLADGRAGLMILVNQDVRGLLVHVPAALIWAMGISVLDGQIPWRALGSVVAQIRPGAADQRLHRPVAGAAAFRLSRWMVTSTLLGLVLFPGLGPIGCTLAFGLSHLVHRGSQRDLSAGDLPDAPNSAVRLDQPIDPLLDLQIQPLVDVLRQPNSELKRAAIEVLGRRSGGEAVHLVRAMLNDPDPDVRGDAAVTLCRLEDNVNRVLSQAAVRATDDLDDAARYADLCYRYATSDLLDEASRRYYLAQARDSLHQVTSLQPERTELWMDLARVQHDLGDTAAALQALDRAQALRPGHVNSYLLAMEIAFDGRDWDRLVLHAQQGQVAAADDSEHWELLGWWAQAHPACLRTHGASRDERDHHVHMLAYTAMGRADAGLPPSSEEAHLAPIAEGAVQEGMDEKRLAHMAECYTLEQRWAELHEGVLRLDQEWQRLMEAFTSCEGAGRNGQLPAWAEQAATFFDLSTHAEHTSALAAEALQTCARFAQALQQAVQGA